MYHKLVALGACDPALDFVKNWVGSPEGLWGYLTGPDQGPHPDMDNERPVHWAWWLVRTLNLSRVPAEASAWRLVKIVVRDAWDAGLNPRNLERSETMLELSKEARQISREAMGVTLRAQGPKAAQSSGQLFQTVEFAIHPKDAPAARVVFWDRGTIEVQAQCRDLKALLPQVLSKLT